MMVSGATVKSPKCSWKFYAGLPVLPRALRDMHHLAFLNKYIPEFKRIYCMVQHDAYHVYTVDIHSIFAVEEIEKLWIWSLPGVETIADQDCCRHW